MVATSLLSERKYDWPKRRELIKMFSFLSPGGIQLRTQSGHEKEKAAKRAAPTASDGRRREDGGTFLEGAVAAVRQLGHRVGPSVVAHGQRHRSQVAGE